MIANIINTNELTFPCLVYAFKKNELQSEELTELLPFDIVEMDELNNSDIGLVLEKGKYILPFKDKPGKTTNKEIEIE